MARKHFLGGLGFNFFAGIFKYKIPGGVINWVVVFLVSKGGNIYHGGFIQAVSGASRDAPTLLLRH